MVAAGLTIIRAWMAAGRPRLGVGKTASFENWDELIRQPICWIASRDQRFADPLKATERAFELDPETSKISALLQAWHATVGDARTSVADIIRRAEGTNEGALLDALDEVAGERGNINRRRLARWVEKHADRRVGGYRFSRDGVLHGYQMWKVICENKKKSDPKFATLATSATQPTTEPSWLGDKGGKGGKFPVTFDRTLEEEGIL